MPHAHINFHKPAKSPNALLRHLQLKGLDTRKQKAKALQALEFIGYHRLLIYMRPLQDAQKRFFATVQFDDILQLYDFDRRLRLVFLDAIDRIEVAFRSVIINTLALDKACGPHFYQDAIHFTDGQAHRDLLKQVLGLREKGNAALKHYYETYNTPALPPVWTVLEAMTIGQLSCLFSDLHLDHRKTVAAKFRYDESVLSTWLQSLTLLRNVCAHHGRLWNASITAGAPKYAKAITAEFPSHNDRGRVFARAVVVQALLAEIDPTSDWKYRFKHLMATLPMTVLAKAGRTTADLGLVDGWESRQFWS
ncbi:Abi family protein [Pseudomonas luteola]|uniref:DNA-binding protein n=1 Tax=Pseudomonas luteola TaxID=47886 RepID=A0A2X2BYW4_PSELU|nr:MULTISPECIES: Abi family protein [Pseudomonas]MCG7374015.1 Abi family protein [Pseudomonas luteola]SHJ72579.1 Abortive infection bacteriophage resistance protein [Pseudomonas zeshuii]SPZ00193.1 DNA-binding protein [Pseudomonas luteola]